MSPSNAQEPAPDAIQARRLAAELENCWADARSLGLHAVADTIEVARDLLVALASSRMKVDLQQPPTAECHTNLTIKD